ncbi:MAG: hypothetical protein N2V75_00045 [Methanophagales archaeon]|nr:hypothetical protein [Methanophagales archaeon]
MPLNKLLSIFKDEDAERKTVVVRFGTVAAGTTDERPVFVAPYPAEIVAASLVNASAISKDATNYETFTLRDKGGDGTADNVIGTITTQDVSGGQAFAAFDEVEFSTIDADHRILAEGDVVTLKKVPSGSGVGTDEMLVKIEYKRH